MDDIEMSARAMHALRDLGVRLAVDDFGTGYSSLAYLKQLPVDSLKIDRSFIDGLPSDPHDRSITEAIVTLGNSLGLTIVAEGVETVEQWIALDELGCAVGQGFLWSPPIPAAAFAPLITGLRRTALVGTIDSGSAGRRKVALDHGPDAADPTGRHQDPADRARRPRRLRRRRPRHRARGGRHPEPRRCSCARAPPGSSSRSVRASRPGPAPATSVCSATTPSSSSSAVARSPPPGSTSSCAPVTSPPAATSPASTRVASSPTAAPGRIPDPEARAVVERLQAAVGLPGIEVLFRHEREHRVLVVLRGPGLDPRLVRHRPPAHRRRAAGRRATRPRGEAHRRPHRRGRRADPHRARRRPQGERRALPWLRHPPGAARASTSASGCAPPRSRSTRCTAASPDSSGWTCSGRPADLGEQLEILRESLERLRLLLPAPQVHRLGRRRRRPRPQDRGDREPRRRRPRPARARHPT